MSGGVPPHNLDMERALLCCCLIDPDAYSRILGTIKNPLMFYDIRHQHIFIAMVALFNTGKPIDALTVCDELERTGNLEKAGSVTYITGLSNETATATHVVSYAKSVNELGVKRGIVTICRTGINDVEAGEKDSIEIISTITASTAKASEAQADPLIGMGDAVTSSLEWIEKKRSARKSGREDFPLSGIPMLDRKLGGFEPATLYIIAGRPSTGKSDLMLNMVYNMSKRFKVGVISAEMSLNALMARLWSLETEIKRGALRGGYTSDEDVEKLYKAIEFTKRNIRFDFTSSPTAPLIKSRIVTMQVDGGLDVVFIDHLHELGLHTTLRTDTNNWRAVIKFLRDTTRDCNVPVILLAQLSRRNENDNRRPQLRDLREAGEEPADVVLMLHREGYQKSDITEDVLEIWIRKNRDGPLGKIDCVYQMDTGQIRQLEGEPPVSDMSTDRRVIATQEPMPF